MRPIDESQDIYWKKLFDRAQRGIQKLSGFIELVQAKVNFGYNQQCNSRLRASKCSF